VTCERAPSFLGAYVLGALDPDEMRAAEQHLAECPACAAELREFRELTALLDRVPLEEVTAEPVTPSPELFDRVAAAAGERRPVRSVRRRWAVAAAAAAVLAVGGITWIVTVGADEEPRIATAGSVRMTVVPDERNEGTALDVTVDGLGRGAYCALVVTDDDGGKHPAGEWTVPGGQVQYDVWTDVDRDSVEDVVLLGDEGEVLRVDLTD
jgi:ferric-dicitrate binding protein FerR (iron transport regulator)